MAKKLLRLGELGEFDGCRLSHAFDVELAKIVADMADRPGDKAPRKLLMQFEFTTVAPTLVLDDVEMVVKIQAKVPPRATRKYHTKSKGGTGLVFNDESPDSVDQGTFADQERERGQ